jgi:hypothetical protein
MSYKYSVNVGLVQEKLINMKKLVFGVLATATVVGGADGQQTGINNSAVCGNRQSN